MMFQLWASGSVAAGSYSGRYFASGVAWMKRTTFPEFIGLPAREGYLAELNGMAGNKSLSGPRRNCCGNSDNRGGERRA